MANPTEGAVNPRSASLRLCVLLLSALLGCAAGQAVPIRTAPQDGALLAGWDAVEVAGDRCDFAVAFTGDGDLRVLLDDREVLGCLKEQRPAPGATDGMLLRCSVAGLAPGDHRLVVARAGLLPQPALRERGLGVEPPAEGARTTARAGQWWSPWGWERPGPVASEDALARWVRVGPADLREGVLVGDGSPPEAIAAEGAGGMTQQELELAVAGVQPDPGPGRAIAAFLRGEGDAAALARALEGREWDAGLAASAPAAPSSAAPGTPALLPLCGAATGAGGVAGGAAGARVAADGPEHDEGLSLQDLPLAWTVQLALGGVILVYNAHAAGGVVQRWLVATRRAHRALALGRLRVLAARQDVLVLQKTLSGPGATVLDLALLAVNRGAGRVVLDEPLPPELTRSAPLHDAWSGQPLEQGANGRLVLELPPRTARLWVSGEP